LVDGSWPVSSAGSAAPVERALERLNPVDAAAQRAERPVLAPKFARKPLIEAGCDAIEALMAQSASTILVIAGAHRLLGESRFVQFLSESVEEIERLGHSVILLSAIHRDCVELDRERIVLWLGLPDDDELRDLVLSAVTSAANPTPDPQHVQDCLQASRGMTRSQLRRALRRLREHTSGQELVIAINQEKRDLIARGGVLEVCDHRPSLDQIGGLDRLKEWLGRRRRALTPAARDFGLPAPRGVLLVGVQGCGKSQFAKASAEALGLALLRFDLGRLFTHDNAPEQNLRKALAVAEAMSPVVLWVDEIDKAFAGANSGVTARIFGTFLTWLAEHPDGIFVAATANRVDHLPAELLRKGRFDETFFVDLPDQEVRAEVLAIHIQRSGRQPSSFDLERLAKTANRLTGAEIEQAVAEGLAVAFDAGRELENDDIDQALSQIVPFVETYEEQVKELRDWARRRARRAGTDRSLRDLFSEAHAEELSGWRP
ncbi:MAG: hypothetical protein CMH53_09390, partial [Myxococcales bacterium]|nr:hypothetical protein [Myxococcales bacterium]